MLKSLLRFRHLALSYSKVPLNRICGAPGVALCRKFSSNPFKGPAEFVEPEANDGFAEVKESGKSEPLDKEKKLKVMELEMDVVRQEGRRAPNPANVKPEQWEQLLAFPSRSARLKYYGYLWQIEKRKENYERKRLEKQEKMTERKEAEKLATEQNEHIIYGLSHTTLTLRIYDTTMNFWQNNRLIHAMQFGEKLIIDCSYDQYMTRHEASNAAKQLMITFAENRMHKDPFNLYYCNANMQGTTMQHLERHIPTIREPAFPLNLHEECFTKIFPKERLVYLTPHCKNELLKYNPDDIYIIGAMVDKKNSEPLSLAKAKRLGLRMAKLPLDRYLQWGAGSGKSLTINQVLNIMLDVKETGDWNHALRHVPRRKLITYSNEEQSDNEVDESRTLTKRAEKFSFDIDSWGNRNRFRKKL